jgi:hypothetical protein
LEDVVAKTARARTTRTKATTSGARRVSRPKGPLSYNFVRGLIQPTPTEPSPTQRISKAIDDIVYEKINLVCNSMIFVVEDFRDSKATKTSGSDFRRLLKSMYLRREKWMQR